MLQLLKISAALESRAWASSVLVFLWPVYLVKCSKILKKQNKIFSKKKSWEILVYDNNNNNSNTKPDIFISL